MLLWVGGVYMDYAVKGGWGEMNTAFWLKIAAVLVLTGASLTGQYLGLTATRRDPKTMAPLMAKIGMTGSGSAVIAFS